MTESERTFVGFALDVLAIGGNGEGWALNDAVSALRVALGEDGVNDNWHTALNDDDRARLRSFVGSDHLDG
jgi:hypothetical protein